MSSVTQERAGADDIPASNEPLHTYTETLMISTDRIQTVTWSRRTQLKDTMDGINYLSPERRRMGEIVHGSLNGKPMSTATILELLASHGFTVTDDEWHGIAEDFSRAFPDKRLISVPIEANSDQEGPHQAYQKGMNGYSHKSASSNGRAPHDCC